MPREEAKKFIEELQERYEETQTKLEERVEKSVRDFLLANLQKDEEGNFSWRMNLDAIRAGYSDLISGLTSEIPFEGKVLFIKGQKSDYILKKHEKEMLKLFPNAEIQEIKDAGHWAHAEQPELFQSMVYKFLNT